MYLPFFKRVPGPKHDGIRVLRKEWEIGVTKGQKGKEKTSTLPSKINDPQKNPADRSVKIQWKLNAANTQVTAK